jgi:hypothetical protein
MTVIIVDFVWSFKNNNAFKFYTFVLLIHEISCYKQYSRLDSCRVDTMFQTGWFRGIFAVRTGCHGVKACGDLLDCSRKISLWLTLFYKPEQGYEYSGTTSVAWSVQICDVLCHLSQPARVRNLTNRLSGFWTFLKISEFSRTSLPKFKE